MCWHLRKKINIFWMLEYPPIRYPNTKSYFLKQKYRHCSIDNINEQHYNSFWGLHVAVYWTWKNEIRLTYPFSGMYLNIRLPGSRDFICWRNSSLNSVKAGCSFDNKTFTSSICTGITRLLMKGRTHSVAWQGYTYEHKILFLLSSH